MVKVYINNRKVSAKLENIITNDDGSKEATAIVNGKRYAVHENRTFGVFVGGDK
jgi:hypothetical protein